MQKVEEKPRGIAASLAKALDRHFVACAATATVAAVAGHSEQSQAAVVYSGPQNVTLTNGSPGIYINLVTNASSGIPAGWDINPYVNGGSSGSFFGLYLPPGTTQVVKSSSPTAGGGDIGKLTAGTVIGPASTFIGQPAQFGFYNNATVGDWQPAGSGYMGIEFTEPGVNGGNLVYGWVQIAKAAAGEPARGGPTGITYVDWAYDDTGAPIAAGATTSAPEPASLALLAAGAMGLMARRGRVKLRRSETAAA